MRPNGGADVEASAERSLRERLIALAVLVACLSLLLAMGAVYAWIARRPFALTTIVGGLSGLFALGMFGALTRRRIEVTLVPEPLRSTILATLDMDSAKTTLLRRGRGGHVGTFPRPMVNGRSVVIPDRVLRDWSSGAIVWNVRTEVAVGQRFARRSGLALAIALVLLLIGMALLDRWRLATGLYLLIPFATISAVTALACLSYYRLEKIEDRRITKTPEDLDFAREALLYPYSAQRERPPLNKWMFSSAELRGRARHLGIDLDAEIQSDETQAAKRA